MLERTHRILSLSLLLAAQAGCSAPADDDGSASGNGGGSGLPTGGVAGTGAAPGSGGVSGVGGEGIPTGGFTGSGGEATGGVPGTGGATDTGGASGSGGGSGGGGPAPHFSFFATSLNAIRAVSGDTNGFGGDLRYGETGPGAGLRGADKICTEIAERSMPGNGKTWRAFLSAHEGDDGNPVNAIDRIGEGPWYDRLGRPVAANKAALQNTRPQGAHADIINDLPNEDGVPNHNPDGTGKVDNHQFLTGSNTMGELYSPNNSGSTCNSWTSTEGSQSGPKPRMGHTWPRSSEPFMGFQTPPCTGANGMDCGDHWISAFNGPGCAKGIELVEYGPARPGNYFVGAAGGYGGFYCFALTP